MLRPERIVLAPAADVANRFTARVEELIYHGDHIRLRVATCGCTDIRIKLPAHAGVNPTPGGEIAIGWRQEDCRALALS